MTTDQADHMIKLLHQIAAAQLGMIDAIAAIRLHQTSTLVQNDNDRLVTKRTEGGWVTNKETANDLS